MNKQLFAGLVCSALLTACASQMGAVVPLQGGTHQSVVKATDKPGAIRMFDNDAKLTCGGGGIMAKAGKYAVISQTAKEKEAAGVKTDNKTVDATIAVGLKYLRLQDSDTYELTTVFKCE
jgi:hypothetical protein